MDPWIHGSAAGAAAARAAATVCTYYVIIGGAKLYLHFLISFHHTWYQRGSLYVSEPNRRKGHMFKQLSSRPAHMYLPK